MDIEFAVRNPTQEPWPGVSSNEPRGLAGTKSRRVSMAEPSLVNVIRVVKGSKPGGLVGTAAPFQDPTRWAAFDWLKLAVEVKTTAATAVAIK